MCVCHGVVERWQSQAAQGRGAPDRNPTAGLGAMEFALETDGEPANIFSHGLPNQTWSFCRAASLA
eukprot:5895953-Lingulodinium_polyedra.AAC.1